MDGGSDRCQKLYGEPCPSAMSSWYDCADPSSYSTRLPREPPPPPPVITGVWRPEEWTSCGGGRLARSGRV